MTRHQPGIIGQAQHLGADVVYERILIPTGQVRPADAPLEDGVSTQHAFQRWQVKDDVTRAVAGDVANLHGCRSQR